MQKNLTGLERRGKIVIKADHLYMTTVQYCTYTLLLIKIANGLSIATR